MNDKPVSLTAVKSILLGETQPAIALVNVDPAARYQAVLTVTQALKSLKKKDDLLVRIKTQRLGGTP